MIHQGDSFFSWITRKIWNNCWLFGSGARVEKSRWKSPGSRPQRMFTSPVPGQRSPPRLSSATVHGQTWQVICLRMSQAVEGFSKEPGGSSRWWHVGEENSRAMENMENHYFYSETHKKTMGKLWFNGILWDLPYGKSPVLMGKLTINCHFQ